MTVVGDQANSIGFSHGAINAFTKSSGWKSGVSVHRYYCHIFDRRSNADSTDASRPTTR